MVSLLGYKRADNDVGNASRGLLIFWLCLQVAGSHFFLPILAAVFTFSQKARRHPTLTNVCLTWIISGVCSSMLLYTGTFEGPEPPVSLCIAQSALVYAVPPMTAAAIFALVFQVWLGVFHQSQEVVDPRWRRFRTTLMLSAPYIIFLSWATAAAWIGVNNPQLVSRRRRFFYCSLDFAPFSNGIGVFSALILVATTVFEVWLGAIMYKNWRDFRDTGRKGNQSQRFIIRVLLFGVYVFIGLIFSLLSITSPKSPIPDIWVASVGMMVVLIFGTSRAVFQSLAFWRKGEPLAPAIASKSFSDIEGLSSKYPV